MPTLTKIWNFNTDNDGFALTHFTRNTTDGSPDPGCLQNYVNARNVTQNATATQTLTYESLGVPAGAVITSLSFKMYRICAGYSGTIPTFNYGVSHTRGTLFNTTNFTSTTAWGQVIGNIITGLFVSSNSADTITLFCNISTGGGPVPLADARFDTLELIIEYSNAIFLSGKSTTNTRSIGTATDPIIVYYTINFNYYKNDPYLDLEPSFNIAVGQHEYRDGLRTIYIENTPVWRMDYWDVNGTLYYGDSIEIDLQQDIYINAYPLYDGDGTLTYPLAIRTVADFFTIGGLSGSVQHFLQLDNLNFQGIDFEPGFLNGTYNGNHLTINNVNINKPTLDYVGLFRETFYLSSTSLVVLQNININDITITGQHYVGGLVGKGHIMKNCHIKRGNITGTDYVGGMVGHHSTNAATDQIVHDCSFTGNVTGSMAVGGFSGLLNGMDLARCSSNAYVYGLQYVGGFVGYIYAGRTVYINYCYAEGTAEGYYSNTHLSDFCAQIQTANLNGTVSLYNTYAACTLIGSTVNYRYAMTHLDAAIWFGNLFIDNSLPGSRGMFHIDDKPIAERYTTAQMKDYNNFKNIWDYKTIWNIDPSKLINKGYSFFRTGKFQLDNLVVSIDQAQKTGVINWY